MTQQHDGPSLLPCPILKGVGKINGDGWKDTTRVGEIVFAWNEELPSTYARGQYPRVGCEGWSASVDQYDFVPATADDLPAIREALNTRPTQPQAEGLVEDKFTLWFFRECNAGTRRHLFSIFGLPVDEITNHGTERIALRRILRALRLPEPSEEMVEKAWREGFQAARECLADDEAFTLTEDVEEDAWRDSTARAALSSLSLPDR